jgi:hypothetical protein
MKYLWVAEKKLIFRMKAITGPLLLINSGMCKGGQSQSKYMK